MQANPPPGRQTLCICWFISANKLSCLGKPSYPPTPSSPFIERLNPSSSGGQTVKSLSAAFLADLEDDWRAHGKEVFPILRTKFPQAYFAGLVALSKVIRWEVGMPGEFDRSLTPDEIMVKLEQRVGPEGRKLFERFMRDVNKLQMKQVALQQAEEVESDD